MCNLPCSSCLAYLLCTALRVMMFEVYCWCVVFLCVEYVGVICYACSLSSLFSVRCFCLVCSSSRVFSGAVKFFDVVHSVFFALTAVPSSRLN